MKWPAADLVADAGRVERVAMFTPRGRFRHARRYYAKLWRALETEAWPERGWFEFGHAHVDWNGDGNRSAKHRRRHLEAGLALFRRIHRTVREWNEPAQCWLAVDPLDSSQDAVFIHTRNPNEDNFPFDFAGVEWDVPVPGPLRAMMADPALQLGRSCFGSALYWVRMRPEPATRN